MTYCSYTEVLLDLSILLDAEPSNCRSSIGLAHFFWWDVKNIWEFSAETVSIYISYKVGRHQLKAPLKNELTIGFTLHFTPPSLIVTPSTRWNKFWSICSLYSKLYIGNCSTKEVTYHPNISFQKVITSKLNSLQ